MRAVSARGDSTTAAELRKIKLIDWAILGALGVCGTIALSMNNRLIELNTTVATQSETMRDQASEIKSLREQVAGVNALSARMTAAEARISTNERVIESMRSVR